MALLPLQDHRCALVWTRSPADATRLAQAHESVFLAELQDAFGYRLGALQQVGARHLYPLTLIEAEEQVRSGLVVLGNAATACIRSPGRVTTSRYGTWMR